MPGNMAAVMRRYNQGIAIALGDHSSVRKHREEIERSNTVEEAWVSVGEALRSAMTDVSSARDDGQQGAR